MNPQSKKQAGHLFDTVRKGVRGTKNVDIVLCPPSVYLDSFFKKTSKLIQIGSQDSFWESKGAFTGEVSPTMIRDLGCAYVILGHSERKRYLNETCELINKKIKEALRARLKVVLCVGEESRDSFDENGKWLGEVDLVLKDQVLECLDDIDESQISNVIIAYEPIWAIGTGNPASPDDALSASLLIRKIIGQKYSKKTAMAIKVLYGGSVDSKNVVSFLRESGVDGALVGGASLNGSEFIRMVKLVEEVNDNS